MDEETETQRSNPLFNVSFIKNTCKPLLHLQQLLDMGSPCFREQGEGRGRLRSAGEGLRRDSRWQQVEVGHSHSSFQVKDNHVTQHRSGQELHEKLRYTEDGSRMYGGGGVGHSDHGRQSTNHLWPV